MAISDTSVRLEAVPRDSLTAKVYARLREALMTGQFTPGQRLSIRQLTQQFKTSATPVREAMMQLVREGALELRPGHLLRVPEITIDRYLELRDIRMPLESLAAERAAAKISAAELERLETLHRELIAAEDEGRWKEALAVNQEFHFTIYRASGMPALVNVIESLWLQIGPFVTYQYPDARPTYPAGHEHEKIIAALRRRDGPAAGQAVIRDTIQGGSKLVQRLIEHIQRNEAATGT